MEFGAAGVSMGDSVDVSVGVSMGGGGEEIDIWHSEVEITARKQQCDVLWLQLNCAVCQCSHCWQKRYSNSPIVTANNYFLLINNSYL